MMAEQKHDTRPIRVCFIAPKAYPIFNPAVKEVFGGAQLDLYLLATELAKDPAFKVSFITADYGQNADENIENVRIIRSFKFSQNSVSAVWCLLKAIGGADAEVYFLKASAAGAFLVALYTQLRRKTFIYRTASEEECNGIYAKKHRLAGMIFNWALKQARYVLVQNQADAVNLARTVGIKAIHIPNGHRITTMDTVSKRYILWVGRSAAIKRPEFFVELARQFPAERFVMICQKNIDDRKYDILTAEAKKVPNLDFIEHVPFEQIHEYYQRAKLLVNTSDSEGFPNTFIQAGIHSTAILSLNVNPDGFLDAYRCGCSCGGSWERFREALADMLGDEKYQVMGENIRRYVEQHHDIAVLVNRYKEILTTLCGERSI